MSTEHKRYRQFWILLISGMLTGMGNGSVFGAAMMCFLGRGPFENWGGAADKSFDPATFSGFVNWSMIVFGIAFCTILYIGLGRHQQAELKEAA